jgi:hypothetical protein
MYHFAKEASILGNCWWRVILSKTPGKRRHGISKLERGKGWWWLEERGSRGPLAISLYGENEDKWPRQSSSTLALSTIADFCGCAFPVFAKAKISLLGLSEVPLGRVGLGGDSFALLHLQHFPLQRAHPVPPVPRIPPSANLPRSAHGDCGRLPWAPGVPRRAPVPGLQPSSSVPGLRGPRVTFQELRGTPRRRTCGSDPGRCPPAPSGRGRLTSGGRGRWLSLGVARPRHPRQPGRAFGGGQRPGLDRLRGRNGERELGDPARLRRQVGRAGWGSRRRDRPCAPPSPAGRGAGAAELSPPLAPRTQAWDPGRWGSALQSTLSVLEARSLSRGDLLCSEW